MKVKFSLKPVHIQVLASAAGQLVAVVFGADSNGRRALGVVCDLVAAGYLENPRTRLRGGMYLLTATLTDNGRAVAGEWRVDNHG